MITSNNYVSDRTYSLPPLGKNPSTQAQGTSPGSFSLLPKIANGRVGRWTFASPDTPGMPAPSEKTAWDFMPLDWTLKAGFESDYERAEAWDTPAGFKPVTQLESARLGIITPEMERVA